MSSVVFWKGSTNLQVNDDKSTLPDGLEEIQVNAGQWIVYNEACYGGPAGKSQVYTAPTGREELTQFPPASIREVPTHKSRAVMLYEHVNFGGKQMKISDDDPNVQSSGIEFSSIIVSGGNWRLFEEKDFQGLGRNLAEGLYATPSEMGIPNDTLKSIRKVSD